MVQVLKANTTRGEVTPLVGNRTDSEFYKAAAKSIKNWVVLRYGGLRRRSGTRFRKSTKFASMSSTLIPFVFSSTQAFMLEFGDEYIRFFTPAGAVVLDTDDNPLEVWTAYAADDVSRIQWAQDGDTVFLAHPSYHPTKLVRRANDFWELEPADFYDGPYLPINDTDTTVTPSSAPTTGASITITFSSTEGVNSDDGLASTDVGRLIRFQFDGSYSWGIITAVASTTECTVLVKEGNSGTTASITWRLGAFSDTTGWPGSVSFSQGRLTWGRTNSNPNGVGLSYSGLPEDFSPSDKDGTVTDAHGMWYDIRGAGEIVWLSEAPTRLIAGTHTSIRTVGGTSGDDIITPRNVRQSVESQTGTIAMMPAKIGPSTVHPGRFGRTIRDMYFDYNINSFATPPLSMLAEHMFKRGVAWLAFAQEPDTMLWSCNNSGELIGTTFDREERIIGFHRHPMENGVVERGAVVPDEDAQRDVLFLIVRRVIDGQTVRYIETLDAMFDGDLVDKEDAFFVDCGLSYDGAATGTLTGLDHLEGETVDILADGAPYPAQVVTGGAITLPNSRTASKWSVGLHIDASGETLVPAPEKNIGSTVGDKQQTKYVIVNEYETLGLEVGASGGPSYQTVRFRDATTPMGQSPALHTGAVRVPIDAPWNTDGRVVFRAAQPLPATILSFNIGVDT